MRLSQIIEVRPDDFDQLAFRPDRGRTTTVKMARCRGRSGDLVVIQMRSGIGGSPRDLATLRSLGLKGVNSASLRWQDESTLGMVRSVRHLVGIVKLSKHFYTYEIEEVYESVKYGTPSQPGETWRTHRGEYLGYDTEGRDLVLYMSTKAGFDDLLAGIQACGLEIEPSSDEAFIGVKDRSRASRNHGRGRFPSAMTDVDPSDVVRAVLPCRTYGPPSDSTTFVTITWQAPYVRFHDMDREASEIGVLATVSDGNILRALKGRFAEESVIANCELQIRHRQGRLTV